MSLKKLQSNLQKLDVFQIMNEVVEANSKWIADINREQLADEGIGEDGSNLSPPYTEFTDFIKTNFRTGTANTVDHVTLYDTGALHKSIFANEIGGDIILDSKDSKVDELTSKYGKFLGIAPKNLPKLKNKLLSDFYERLNSQILQGL